MARRKTIGTISFCMVLAFGVVVCPSAPAGPIDNAQEAMQSQIDLQTGEENDAPPATPMIEWADDTTPADGSIDRQETGPVDRQN